MKLYHGTSDSRWLRIKEEGLLPRGASGQSNWSHSIESNPDAVYLTSGYALYFGINSIDFEESLMAGKTRKAVVIEIDTDDLEPERLVPDEDALEQATRKGSVSNEEMVQRTREFRDEVVFWAREGFPWVWSINTLGTCGHLGPILPSQFSRVALVDIREEAQLSMLMMDVSISVANHHFLKDRNENVHRLLFGDPLLQTPMAAMFPLPPLGTGVQVLDLRANR